MSELDLARLIRDVPDFPRAGILFKDITTLLKDAPAFRRCLEVLAESFRGEPIDLVAGVESRGFIFAAPLAYLLGAGFVPIRKQGHLPAASISGSYDLEYGHNTLEVHRDAIEPGQRVLIVDDLLATGGTVLASMDLVRLLGGEILGLAFLIELRDLKGRELLARANPPRIVSVLQYPGLD